jgi:hypothetical protein
MAIINFEDYNNRLPQSGAIDEEQLQEAMNFIDEMCKHWKRLCIDETRVITGHKLNLKDEGADLSVLAIDLEEQD